MDELLNKMNKFWDTYEATGDEDGKKFFDRTDDNKNDYDELENLFWEHLIGVNHFNLDTKRFLSDNGYYCWAGDRDSFGILVACVTKDNKTFSFG